MKESGKRGTSPGRQAPQEKQGHRQHQPDEGQGGNPRQPDQSQGTRQQSEQRTPQRQNQNVGPSHSRGSRRQGSDFGEEE